MTRSDASCHLFASNPTATTAPQTLRQGDRPCCPQISTLSCTDTVRSLLSYVLAAATGCQPLGAHQLNIPWILWPKISHVTIMPTINVADRIECSTGSSEKGVPSSAGSMSGRSGEGRSGEGTGPPTSPDILPIHYDAFEKAWHCKGWITQVPIRVTRRLCKRDTTMTVLRIQHCCWGFFSFKSRVQVIYGGARFDFIRSDIGSHTALHAAHSVAQV